VLLNNNQLACIVHVQSTCELWKTTETTNSCCLFAFITFTANKLRQLTTTV